jgi:hypothetical protein
MNSRWISTVVVIFGVIFTNAQALAAENESAKNLMIADFEKEAVLKKIDMNAGVSVRLTDKDVVTGKRALEVRVQPLSKSKNRWPLIGLGPKYIKAPINCAKYSKISVTVRNVTKGSATMLIGFSSKTHSGNGVNMDNTVFKIPGGTTMVCEVPTSSFKKKFNNSSSIRYIQVRFPPNKIDAVYRIDSIKAVEPVENKSQKTLMIADFENEAVLKKIDMNAGVSVRLTGKDVVSGKRALEVRVQPFSKSKNQWPLISFGPNYIKVPIDCANYTKISVTIRNVTSGLATMITGFSSKTHAGNGANIENSIFQIPGGTIMVCETSTSSFKKKFNDPSSIRYFHVRFPPNGINAVYRIDSIKAVRTPSEGFPVKKMISDAKSVIKQLSLVNNKINWDAVPKQEQQKLKLMIPKFKNEAKRILAASEKGQTQGLKGKYNSLRQSLDTISRNLGGFVLAGKRGFCAWEISPYINIYKDELPDLASPKVEKLDVKMALDEFRDKVFMVNSCGKDAKIKVEVKPSKGLPAKAISIRESLYYKVDNDDLGDALYDLKGPLVVPKGQSRQIWLRFDARHSGLKPGDYSFTVILSDLESGKKQTIPGKLTVWDFKLPSYNSIPNNAYVEFFNSFMGKPDVIAQSVEHMKMYGLNIVSLYPHFLPWPVTVDKDLKIVTFDDSVLRKQLLPVIKAWKAAPGNEKLQFCFFLFKMPELLLKRKDIRYPSKEWNGIFRQWMVLLQKSLRKLGLTEKDYVFMIADEENASVLVNDVLPQAELIKSIDPNIRMYTNSAAIITDKATSFRFYKTFDFVLGKLQNINRYPHLAEWIKQGGKAPTFCMYKCDSMAGRNKNLYKYYRVFGWNNYKYGNVGTGMWTYCAQGSSPWGSPGTRTERTKRYCLIFKHKDKAEIVHSRRYEFYRQGVDDFRYLKTLKKLASSKGPKVEAAADKLIKEAIKDILANVQDTTRCDKWRIRIAQEILKLKKK